MEARSFSPDKSRQMLAKVKEYKGDLAKLREDAKKAAASGADTRCANLAKSSHWVRHRKVLMVEASMGSPETPLLKATKLVLQAL